MNPSERRKKCSQCGCPSDDEDLTCRECLEQESNKAFNEGYRDGKKLGYDEGFEKGYSDGFKDASEIAIEQIEEALKAIEKEQKNR